MSFKHYWDYEYECRRLEHIRKQTKKPKKNGEKEKDKTGKEIL